MASILKRGDYSFQVIIRRRGYATQTKTLNTKSDAVKWARMVEREMDRSTWRDTSMAESMTLGDVLSRYKNEVTPGKKSADIEVVKINALLRDSICTLGMSNISRTDIAAWRDRRLKTVKGSSVNREMAIITHAIDISRKEWGLNIDNPCQLVRKAPSSSLRDRRLSAEEEGYLMNALDRTKNPYIKPMVILAIETAMRRGELLSMEFSNIDFKKKTVLLPDTKNGEKRDVPLSPTAISVLKALPISDKSRVLPISMEAFKQAFVRSVERAREMYLIDCIERAVKPDGKFMVDLHFHDLRHEATSRLFEHGFGIMEVASITGHKTLQMLQRYTHLKAENLAKRLG